MYKLLLLGVVGALIVGACASGEGSGEASSALLESSTTFAMGDEPVSEGATPASSPAQVTEDSGTAATETDQSTREDTTVTTTSPNPDDLAPTDTTIASEPLPSSTTTTAASMTPRGLEPLVAIAVEDLAGRLNVAPSDVVVVSVESVVWPDGSLGCPQPGMGYTQAQVDGSLIVLSVRGVSYDYHSGGVRVPFLCEKS